MRGEEAQKKGRHDHGDEQGRPKPPPRQIGAHGLRRDDRKQMGQIARNRDRSRQQDEYPGTTRVELNRRGSRDSKYGVEPFDRFKLAVLTEQDAGMFGMAAERDATARSLGGIAIGAPRFGGVRKGRESDRAQSLSLQRAFPVAIDHQEIARPRGGDRRREHGDRDRRGHFRVIFGEAHNDVGSHGMSENGDPPVAQPAHGRRHFGDAGHESARRAVDLRQVARKRPDVAPMAGKIEGRADIAVSREGQGERLHEPPGTGKTMRHHNDGGGGSRRRAIDRRRRAADDHGGNPHAGILAVQLNEGGQDGEGDDQSDHSICGRHPIRRIVRGR